MCSLKSSSSAGSDGGGEPPRKQKKLEQCADHEVAETKIYALPDECVLEILSFLKLSELTVAQNVCRQWKRVSHFPVLLHHKTFCVGETVDDADIIAFLEEWPGVGNVILNRTVSEPVIDALCENCGRLKNLKMEHLKKKKYSLLKKLVENCRNIKSLKIPHKLLCYECNSHVLAQLNQLESLWILNSYRADITLCLQPFADGCPQLTILKVLSTINVPNEDLELFIKAKCKTLTNLLLPWDWFVKSNVLPLFKMCTELEKIELCEYHERQNVDLLEAFRVLGQLPSLLSLQLRQFGDCPAGAAALVFKPGLSQLQLLCLNGWAVVDSIFMDALCTGCPILRGLYLKHVTILGEEAFSRLHLLNELEKLSLVDCKGLNGTTIMYVDQVPKLRRLVIEHCDLRVLKPGLQCILDMCHLEILSFAFTKYTCSLQFERIPEKLVKLRVLNVAYCELDERLFQRLKEQIPGLQVYAPDDASRNSQIQKDIMKRLMKL